MYSYPNQKIQLLTQFSWKVIKSFKTVIPKTAIVLMLVSNIVGKGINFKIRVSSLYALLAITFDISDICPFIWDQQISNDSSTLHQHYLILKMLINHWDSKLTQRVNIRNQKSMKLNLLVFIWIWKLQKFPNLIISV